MHTVKLRQYGEGYYWRITYPDSEKIELIADFLTEIGDLVDLVKQDLTSQGAFHFNMHSADLENNEIILYSLYDEKEPRSEARISYEKFLNLLDKWLEVCKNLPDFIEITMDDDENIEIRVVEDRPI